MISLQGLEYVSMAQKISKIVFLCVYYYLSCHILVYTKYINYLLLISLLNLLSNEKRSNEWERNVRT